MIGERIERFYLIAVNSHCRVLGKRLVSSGSLAEVSAYPRICAEAALALNAHGVFLCHNHPGGTCGPSAEDISSTLQLQRLFTGLGIYLHDHIIVAGDDTYSMMQHGDISNRLPR